MPIQSVSLTHRNQYSADSACGHCDGVIPHEAWCVTQTAGVRYASQVVSDPGLLSTGDHLILHALGVAWTKMSLSKARTNQSVWQAISRSSCL
jgi:hypothetical protein